MEGHQVAAVDLEHEAAIQDQLRSLHRAVEEAAAEMARREAVRRRPPGSLLFDDAPIGAPRPGTFDSYAEGVCDLTARSSNWSPVFGSPACRRVASC